MKKMKQSYPSFRILVGFLFLGIIEAILLGLPILREVEAGRQAFAQVPESSTAVEFLPSLKVPEKFGNQKSTPPQKIPEQREVIPGQILVRYKDSKEFQLQDARNKWRNYERMGAKEFSRGVLLYQQRVIGDKGEKMSGNLNKQYGREVIKGTEVFPLLGFQSLNVQAEGLTEESTEKFTEELITKIGKDDNVAYVMKNWKVYPLGHHSIGQPPNDEYWVTHATENDQPSMLWGLEKIQMHEVWGKANSWNGNSTQQVVVAVIDSGIDLHHPDLTGSLWENPKEKTGTMGQDDDDWGDYVDDLHGANLLSTLNNDVNCQDKNIQQGGNITDELGHGTAVAGVIAATGNNQGGPGTGMLGVAGNGQVKIMSLKVFCKGSGTKSFTSVSAILKAIEYAYEMHAHVINASWSLTKKVKESELAGLKKVIQEANDEGILFVASAGNGGANHDNDDEKLYPSSFELDNVIAVAATFRWDALRPDSDRGKTTVHLGAPGNWIYTTDLNGKIQPQDGTSVAAPFVAGCAALLQAQRRAQGFDPLSPKQLKTKLIESVDPMADLADKVISGGSLNCSKAYDLVMSD